MSNTGRKSGEERGLSAFELGTVGSDREAVGPQVEASDDEAAVEPELNRRIQNHLGRKLKEVYDELVRQPVPDKFQQLLDELARKEKEH